MYSRRGAFFAACALFHGMLLFSVVWAPALVIDDLPRLTAMGGDNLPPPPPVNSRLMEILETRADKTCFVKAARALDFGDVAHVIDVMKSAVKVSEHLRPSMRYTFLALCESQSLDTARWDGSSRSWRQARALK